MRNNKYDLRGNNTLSLPKVNTTKYGLNSFTYFTVKQWNSIPNELRLKAGSLEFNKQVRNVTLFGKTGLNKNSVVMHFQCIFNAF